MSFDDLVIRYIGSTFQGIDILGETGVQFALFIKKTNECVGWGRSEFAWSDVSSKCVEGLWVVQEKIYIEDGFWIR